MKTKNLMIFLYCFFLAAIFLTSCEVKEMQQINIHIVGKSKLADSPDSNMPEKFVSFVKPIECEKIVFVPKVTIHRTDLINDSAFVVIVPKSPENKLKYKWDFYDYTNLKDDYNTYLPELKAGLYLSKIGSPNSTKKSFNYSSSDLSFILTDKISSNSNNSYNSSDKIVSVIKNLICSNKFDISKKIIVILDDNSGNVQNDSISADSALVNFHNLFSRNVKSSGIKDSALQKLEREYPNDYRFTLERLKIKTQGGNLKKSDEYLLLLAVEKAINEGKASEILAILNKMNLPPNVKKEAENQISKLPGKEKPLAEDKTISFRKQQIDAKLIILADSRYSPSERKSFKNITLEDFESPEVQVSIESPEFPDKPELRSIYDFLEQLRVAQGYKTKLISKEIGTTGKISSMRVSLSY